MTKTPEIAKHIIYFGTPCVLACDARCDKAWGRNSRPHILLDPQDEDDIAWLADDELGTAPDDPETYEGGHAKPTTTDEQLNKWCARECERSKIAPSLDEIDLPDYSTRFYNMPWKHPVGHALPTDGE